MMRGKMLLLLLVIAISGCSAIDDFSKFRVVGDASVCAAADGGTDLGCVLDGGRDR